MYQAARVIALLYLAFGLLLVAFPHAATEIIQRRPEFSQVPRGALHLWVGATYFLIGALLVDLETRPAVEGEDTVAVSPEPRRPLERPR